MDESAEKPNILVVDDEPGILEYVKTILVPTGYKLLCASGGREALQVAEASEHKIDMLLTDVNMPGMDGLELAEEFLRRYSDTKIMIMSGYLKPDELDHKLAGQQIDFLSKPFSPSELIEKLHELLVGD